MCKANVVPLSHKVTKGKEPYFFYLFKKYIFTCSKDVYVLSFGWEEGNF